MKRFVLLFSAVLLLFNANAQIYAPEGLNIPGSWDGWVNPPTNSVFLSASNGGSVQLISGLSSPFYQSIFATPTDVIAGSYTFLFTSGATGNEWANKWADVAVNLNTIQSYIYYTSGGTDNSITLNDNKYYIMNWEDVGYTDARAVFMELDAAPVSIISVTQDIASPVANQDVTVTITTDNTPLENVYIRYTTDSWVSSYLLLCNFTGTTGTAIIPGQVESINVEYYVFTTTLINPADYDLATINYDNNTNAYYSYTIPTPLSCDNASGVLTTDPIFPLHDGSVVITFDATLGNGDLLNYIGNIYAHTGVITSLSDGNNDWLYVKSDWGVNDPELLFTQIDSTIYQLTINNIRAFYGVPVEEEIYKIAMVIRSEDPILPEEPENYHVARNADGSDLQLEIYTQGVNVKIVGNLNKDPLVQSNATIPICVYAMDATSIALKVDDVQVDQINDLHIMYGLNTGDYASGIHEIVAIATDGTNTAYDTAYFYIRGAVIVEDLPPGVKNGINYIDDNTVTLVLQDPSIAKQYAFVIGDFNNWTASDDGYMKRTTDGQYFWTTITGLTPGVEYAYQYYIDGDLKIADPYCDKILDPWNDRWIPETIYPNLKSYPWDKTLGTVSVFQTAQTDFNWVIDNFTPSAVNANQSDLVIYELLIRDFVESRDIKDVIDSLDYLQTLGINAVELMPVAEFDGNDSWGYAPNFYYAPDKAYGTKNDYKTFIDECHQRGIAVILDVVYNHMYGGSPLVQMYWDSENNEPASNSAWFNQQATHPYSIGYDFNHESINTQNLIKDNLTYWMTEYKFDGFRFDLSKGFTQTNSGGDVGVWSQYDQSRIDILTSYYNHIKSVNPNAYVILEHFADNSEEVVLANTGCMLWGVMNEQFNQTTMGWDTNNDFTSAFYQERGFTYPNLIPFMESHDEERLMYRNLAYGNTIAGDTTAALKRIEAIIPMYMAIPGPKMIWQFGELGYDESITLCGDNSYSSDCRTSTKPIYWNYVQDARRQKLYWTYAGMIKLKTESDAFSSGTFGQDQSGLGKRMWITDASLNASITANFASFGFDMTPSFQHTGTWYNYFTGEQINVSDAAGYSIYYNPGDYYVFTDVQLDRPYANLQFNVKNTAGENISNANVAISGYSSEITGTSGNANFIYGTNLNLNYNVSAIGYNSVSSSFSMGTNDDNEYVVLQASTDIVVNEKSAIKLYPNPTKDFLHIQANFLYKISVYDITGKLVKSFRMIEKSQNINVSDLKSGIYSVIFENNFYVEVKKIIIN